MEPKDGFGMLFEIICNDFVFLYQEMRGGVLSELLGRKGLLTRQLLTVFSWACHSLERVLCLLGKHLSSCANTGVA